MKKIILYPHGGSGNHGCEAIVRTTCNLLKGKEIYLFSENPEEDKYYLKDLDIHILSPHKRFSKLSVSYAKAMWNKNIKKKSNAVDIEAFSPILNLCDKDTVL